MKKAQGLPLNTIVLAVIAIIVLVVVILFATGNLSKLFGSTQTIVSGSTPDEVAAFRIACKQACFQAQQLADTQAEWVTSKYCDTKYKVLDNNVEKHCWDYVSCTKIFSDKTAPKSNCAP